MDDMEAEKDENFEVELYEVNNGGTLGKISKTAVTITNDDEFNSVMNKMMMMTNANVDELRVQNDTWAQQIKDAMVVNGGDLESASTADYVMHFLTFGFKLIFAIIPPPGLLGGYPCFFISLIFIGLIVVLVGDLASIFGCLIGLKDEVTAITFVALGTSLPDTFASKVAAVNEKHADNAIGNVTGSNSVNVFLGLGVPWVIATIYHAMNGSTFQVKAGALTFSVTIYIICAVIAITLILIRRFVPAFGDGNQGAELGGSKLLKYVSAGILLFLWFSYVLLSALQTYGVIEAPF
jgi:solute carrier family 8 (sodium/calcium exchanger)